MGAEGLSHEFPIKSNCNPRPSLQSRSYIIIHEISPLKLSHRFTQSYKKFVNPLDSLKKTQSGSSLCPVSRRRSGSMWVTSFINAAAEIETTMIEVATNVLLKPPLSYYAMLCYPGK